MIPRSRAIAKIPTNRTMVFVNRLLKRSEIRTMLMIKDIRVGRIARHSNERFLKIVTKRNDFQLFSIPGSLLLLPMPWRSQMKGFPLMHLVVLVLILVLLKLPPRGFRTTAGSADIMKPWDEA
jgi:hypothetical protein